jgi:transcriptional regulator with XRE-family HTH domain
MSANGQRIRDLREAKPLGLRKLADLAGVHRSYLSRLERGIKGASPETLVRIAGVLDVPVGAISNDDPS